MREIQNLARIRLRGSSKEKQGLAIFARMRRWFLRTNNNRQQTKRILSLSAIRLWNRLLFRRP